MTIGRRILHALIALPAFLFGIAVLISERQADFKAMFETSIVTSKIPPLSLPVGIGLVTFAFIVTFMTALRK